MNTFKHYLFVAVAMITMISFTSCQDEDEIVNNLVGAYGKEWRGDLGAVSNDRYEEPLVSVLSFEETGRYHGIGTEKLYYADNGEFYGKYDFDWELEKNGRISLYYSNGDTFYITAPYVSERTFTGYWKERRDSEEIYFELHAK